MSAERNAVMVCGVMSQPMVARKPHTYMVCTRDEGHPGYHTACDSHGHVLASWLPMAGERRWQRSDCDSHPHEGTR